MNNLDYFDYILIDNGTIEGEIINLGNYTNDFNWLKAEENNLPISSGVLYHEQNFDMGTICEISQKPRKGVAKVQLNNIFSKIQP